ncbi:Predicted arabinose efflux permease, MFS family [Quadrisphaera granulorum]|uniref:Putative MFS family arabinose efflux permease n=1 Tax=Quadrisphaera granulorum TaxID=317664 RepID=A0A316A8E6_9ACTN|nr:putative MFS family arabinose efflux permease [Quadrisphaera granulorum]SZE96763.1 Predicted arabinose efflux permease, MFS family [Quadrisphaera granulorum]
MSRALPALVAMMLTSFLLVTAEFVPNGMLTEMAAGLGVTPGQAGQTVTATALVGLLVAPTVGMLFPRLDRRTLFVGVALAAGLSNLLVALAPNLWLVLLARVLLGASISAFWAMSITVAARIAGPERLGRSVMFTTAGLSLATVAGVPLGVLLSEALDWRATFVVVGVASLLLAVPLRLFLPTVPAAPTSGLGLLAETLRRPGVALAMTGHVLVVLGHFAAYTYVRLALERVPGADAETVVLLLALFGVGGLVGNVVIGMVIDRAFGAVSVAVPLAVAASVTTVIAVPGSLVAVGTAVTVWGFAFASWLIVVNAWIGRRTPDRLEAGGSLIVVGFQLAIVLAAGLGGLLVDQVGVVADYAIALALLLVGTVLFGLSNRTPASSASAR